MRGSHFPEVHRALFIRDSLLCDPVPEVTFDVPDEGAEFRLTQTECAACHTYIDPLGFAFADFGVIGKYEPLDAEQRARLAAAPSLNVIDFDQTVAGEIESLPAFLAELGESPEVAECIAHHWMAYALSVVDTEGLSESCLEESFATEFSSNGGDLRTLVMRVVEHPSFHNKGSEIL